MLSILLATNLPLVIFIQSFPGNEQFILFRYILLPLLPDKHILMLVNAEEIPIALRALWVCQPTFVHIVTVPEVRVCPFSNAQKSSDDAKVMSTLI